MYGILETSVSLPLTQAYTCRAVPLDRWLLITNNCTISIRIVNKSAVILVTVVHELYRCVYMYNTGSFHSLGVILGS